MGSAVARNAPRPLRCRRRNGARCKALEPGATRSLRERGRHPCLFNNIISRADALPLIPDEIADQVVKVAAAKSAALTLFRRVNMGRERAPTARAARAAAMDRD